MERPKSIDDLTEQQMIDLDPVAFGIYVKKSFKAHRAGVLEQAKDQIIKASWEEAFEIVYGARQPTDAMAEIASLKAQLELVGNSYKATHGEVLRLRIER